jgi:histidine kinase
MTTSDPRQLVAESIGNAIMELSDALAELDRMPVNDMSTIGFVAHAMNNYLSVSEATLDLIRQAVSDGPGGDVATWLDGLRHLGNMMQHTVGRLLHVSAPESFPLKYECVNLPVLMERACEYHRRNAQQKQLQIVFRTIGDVPPAWADRVAVAVVADNLLSNAVMFSDPGGEIVVQIMPGPGGVVCSVRDYGPGLTTLAQAQLFHGGPATPSSKSGQPSGGIGLTIAKELIDRMGGRLWSDSGAGQGATFSFRLPYHAAGLSAPP